MRSAVRRAVQLVLLRSGVGPLAPLYASAYRLTASLASALLATLNPGHVEAVYVRRSAGAGQATPGLSDVDLFFVVREGPEERHGAFERSFRRVCRLFPLLDRHLEAFTPEAIVQLHATNPSLRFRLEEGKATWRLLRGVDRIADLPEPAPTEMAVAHVFELKTRLTYWNSFCLARWPEGGFEEARRDYFLLKSVADLARTRLYLDGAAEYDRERLWRLVESETVRPCGGSVPPEPVRAFVAHGRAHRMRRPFFARDDPRRWPFEVGLLRAGLSLLAELYAAHGAGEVEELRLEHGYFYGDATFLPTGHRVRYVDESLLEEPERLRAEVESGAGEGTDLVMRSGAFLVNLSNTDPALGHCTVVRLPEGARGRGAQ